MQDYIDTHGVLVNPLVEGYPSIGCPLHRPSPNPDPTSAAAGGPAAPKDRMWAARMTTIDTNRAGADVFIGDVENDEFTTLDALESGPFTSSVRWQANSSAR